METYRRHKRLPNPMYYVHEMYEPGLGRKMRDTPRPALPTGEGDEYSDLLHYNLSSLNYTKQQQDEIRREINSLFRSYNVPVTFGAIYHAPCSVWRSERIVQADESFPRFASRVCVFNGEPEFVTGESQNELDSMGGFLGFLSLRPQKGAAPDAAYIAVAHLDCPSHMKRPRYHLLSTVLGPPDGMMPFHGAPYYKPWMDRGNLSTCLHASLYSGLLLKSSTFHCTPISSDELLAMRWREQKSKKKHSMRTIAAAGLDLNECLKIMCTDQVNAGGCVEVIFSDDFFQDAVQRVGFETDLSTAELAARLHRANKKVLQELGIHDPAILADPLRSEDLIYRADPVLLQRAGAAFAEDFNPADPDNATQMATQMAARIEALRKTACAGEDLPLLLLKVLSLQNKLAKREARLCIAEYLANGMPVIAAVDPRGVPHSTLVVGMHYQNPSTAKQDHEKDETAQWKYELSDSFLPSSFVVHDITRQPYCEFPADNLLTAGWTGQHNELTHRTNRSMSYLAITPRGARAGIHQVRKRAMRLLKQMVHDPDQPLKQYKDHFKQDVTNLDNVCVRTFLLSFQDIIRRYVNPVCKDDDEPYETQLQEKLVEYGRARQAFDEQLAKHPSNDPRQGDFQQRYWWCAECHSDTFRTSSFRDYNTFHEPIIIFGWRIDQFLDDPRQSAPEFIIRAVKKGESELKFAGSKETIRFPTRFPEYSPTPLRSTTPKAHEHSL